MTTSSPSDALASNRENCTTSSPRLTSFTIFFFSNIMKNLLFEEQVSPDFQVSQFPFYRISWKICYLPKKFQNFHSIKYICYKKNKFPQIYKFFKKKFSRMSFRLCYLKNRFPHIYKFYIFIYRISRRKLLLEEQFIYWCIIVIICSVWQKDRKRLLLLFGK